MKISDVDNSLNLELALEVAEYFRLDNAEAISTMVAVKQAVTQWLDIANPFGIPRAQQQMMAAAFLATQG